MFPAWRESTGSLELNAPTSRPGQALSGLEGPNPVYPGNNLHTGSGPLSPGSTWGSTCPAFPAYRDVPWGISKARTVSPVVLQDRAPAQCRTTGNTFHPMKQSAARGLIPPQLICFIWQCWFIPIEAFYQNKKEPLAFCCPAGIYML